MRSIAAYIPRFFLMLAFILKVHILLAAEMDSTNTKPEADSSGFNETDCTFNGIKLYGKVKFVTVFPDIKIQYVEHFPDIRVKFVGNFPDKCGRWQVVEHFPDFTVQLVDYFPDLKVKIVEHFPGMD